MRMTFPDDVPILTDGDVTLRAHRAGDVPALLEQALDPVMVAVDHRAGAVRPRRRPVRTRPRSSRRPGSRHRAGPSRSRPQDDVGAPRFCGTVELRNEGDGRAEIAYGAHPWVRGRGVMERACRLLLEWGFATQGLESVIWWANRGNWASRRLAWRLGFACRRGVPRWCRSAGVLLDAWVGALRAGRPAAPRSPVVRRPRHRRGGRSCCARTRTATCPGSSRPAATSGRRTGWAGCRRRTPPEDALAWLKPRRERQATGQG